MYETGPMLYNEYLVSTVDTDCLVVQGISSDSEYGLML